MKYGKYIASKVKKEWAEFYIDYKGLKDLIKECLDEADTAGEAAFSPRTTSLTVQRYNTKDSSQERFFKLLERDVRNELRNAARRVLCRARFPGPFYQLQADDSMHAAWASEGHWQC
jgi:SPX domain protein involved in polyphosphate accumulation